MRKVICLLGLLLCVSLTASAQDSKFDIFAGFNYVRYSDPNNMVNGKNGTFKGFGATGSVAYNLNHWAAIVGEVGYDHINAIPNIDESVNAFTLTYMVGPKVTPFRVKGISPFAQILFGAVHPGGDLSAGGKFETGFTESFAMAAGGGLDVNVGKHFAIRLVQLDYLMTRIGYNRPELQPFHNQNNFRYSGGIVIRLGGK